jgi:predicted small metal-binding protein
MALSDIKVAAGSWLVANCAGFPSEQNCQLVIMGPADQKDDLVSAAVAHAIEEHGHSDSAELREGLAGMIRPVTV